MDICWQVTCVNMSDYSVKADFHSEDVSDWTGNPLFTCENVALNLNIMLRVTNILLQKNAVRSENPLNGNLPLENSTTFYRLCYRNV